MAKPDFLGIGALKAATTLLHSLLEPHPQLCMARGLKEVRFFNLHYDRGLGWYEDLFQPSPGQICGEVSPDYLFDPRCPERIARDLPDVKLIALLRDPVARTWSQYLHFRQERYYRGDLSTYLDEHPNALDRNLYHAQLSRYLERFDRDRILVLIFEAFTAQPAPEIARVYRFLGVDDAFQPPDEGKVNASAVPRFPWLFSLGSRGMWWLRDHGLGPVADAIKATGLRDRLLKRGGQGDERPRMTEADRLRILRHAEADVAQLEALLGMTLRGGLWPMTTPRGA